MRKLKKFLLKIKKGVGDVAEILECLLASTRP
jgi:hypothetical protein